MIGIEKRLTLSYGFGNAGRKGGLGWRVNKGETVTQQSSQGENFPQLLATGCTIMVSLLNGLITKRAVAKSFTL